MAIGVEQLDIKNIAKIFLMKDQLGSAIASEDFKVFIKEALESFTEEDWDEIRENIFPSSDEKKALRSVIEEVKILLSESEIGIREGQYSEYSVKVLESAVKNAESVIRNQKDDTVEDRELMMVARGLLINAKDRFLRSVITEDGLLINGVWYGCKNLLGSNGLTENGKPIKHRWVPAKVVGKYYISLEEIPLEYPSRIELTYIRGLWLMVNGNEIVITREQVPTSLGLTKVEGVILNDYLFAKEEDLEYAPFVSAYLQRPINIAPCRFNGSLLNEDTLAYLQYTTAFTALFANISENDVRNIFHVSTLKSSTLYSTSRSLATAIPGSGIYVDNVNKIITGVGELTATKGEEVATELLCISDGATTKIDISTELIDGETKVSSIIISIQSENKISTSTFLLGEDLVIHDINQDIIDNKCYSKNHPVNKSLTWIPTYVIDNKYYVSPERIDENNIVYGSNKNLIHIVGILDEERGIIYTRQDLSEHELTSPTGKYRLKAVNAGYYNGYLFGGNIGDATILSEYIKYMDIFKKQNFGEACAVGFVQSEFKLYTSANEAEMVEEEYFWEGAEEDVIKLPDTRSDCKFYLNIIAIKAK